MLLEFGLEVSYECLEVLLVVQDQLRDDSLVDFARGELVLRVFDDDGGQLGEVFRDLGGTVLHYHHIVAS